MTVLLITPNFFDYPQIICDEIRSMGHEVDWFDDRPSSNSFVKAIIRLKKDFIHFFIRNYFNKILLTVKEKKYDKVLVISGQSFSFSEEMLLQLKAIQSQAEFVLYQWDSLANFPYIETLEKYFNRCYSFDREDTLKNVKLSFLPLFYCKRYEDIGKKEITEYKYDYLFVGTAHPQKYRFISEMSKKLSVLYKKGFIYFFFPSKLVYIYRKIKNVELKQARYSEFHFEPMTGSEMDHLLSASRCVLDSTQSEQTGLTIRVIETLGAKRKIISTNQDLVNYDFYKEENIYIYDGEFNFDSLFFKSPYKEIDVDIYRKYSLKSWLTILLDN